MRGEVHSNTVEGFCRVFKRGVRSICQYCSEKHLHCYVAEFDFRYSNCVKLGVDDAQRTVTAPREVVGKRLIYQAGVRRTIA